MTRLPTIGHIVLILMAAGLLTAGLIVILSPWLKAYALARPGARSLHREPTPQGGGAAVIAAVLAVAWADIMLAGAAGTTPQLLAITASAVLLAVTGAVDDVRGVSPLPKLALQSVAVGIVVAALPADLHVVPLLPWPLERVLLFVGGVWFVNLTNFMDGIDWMTVAETVPVTGAVIVLGLLGVVPMLAMLIALTVLGAILGFAPFNKPVARLFLGDVGSLPIGLLLGWLLLQVAASGHLAAALILPLYCIADTALTLARRAQAGEPVWEAHRTHFYQRAIDGGFTVTEIVARVFLLNLALAGLALATVAVSGAFASGIALAIGAGLVGWLLMRFAQGKG